MVYGSSGEYDKSNWQRFPNGSYNGYYKNLQKMVEAGLRDPSDFIEANLKPSEETITEESSDIGKEIGKIAFASDRDGNWEIYVMNSDGSEQTNLTNNPASEFNPFWSPDGTHIAFVSWRNENYEIYVMNANGSKQINLTNNPAFDGYPVWSPDGKKIAFESFRDGNYEIYVMNSDGSEQTRLTNIPAYDSSPAWSPIGIEIEESNQMTLQDTEIRFFSPSNVKITNWINGECWTFSIANPCRAFRCIDKNNNIYDPCFLIKDINTDDPERQYGLIPCSSPWTQQYEGEGMRVKSLPKSYIEKFDPIICPPLALELFDGTRCYPGPTGTTFTTEINGEDYALSYGCDDGKGVFWKEGDLPPTYELDKRDKVWKARVIDNWASLQEGSEYSSDKVNISFVPIKIVWY